MRKPTTRRTVFAALTATVLAAGFLTVSHTAAADPEANPGHDLPIFTSTGSIVDPLDPTLPHNPTGEFIFPTVFHAGKYLDTPLAEWYIYYAPHDAPGGINLMYSDSLDGPWTQHEQSPLISNSWPGNYSVSHISSPDAFWNAEEEQLFLYFHGENTVTRFATSHDGVTFEYGGPIISTRTVDLAQPGRHALETSYARVFTHPDPSSGYRYAMFFMVNYSDNTRHISTAFSPDGRVWDVQPEPIVDPGSAEGANVSAADLFRWKGKLYIAYGSTVGTIFARSINRTLTETGEPQPLFIPRPAPPEAGRATSPQFVTHKGQTHLFYEYGERSHTTIGHAILDENGVRDPLNTHPNDPLYERCSAPGSDEFDGDVLDGELWNHVVRPELARHTISEGQLRVPTYAGNSTSAPLILQPLTTAAWEVTTKLTIDPARNFQQAGLIARADDRNSARVDLSHVDAGKRIDFVWRHQGVDRNDTWTMEDAVMAPATMGESLWLRMTNNGDWITASYSIDGMTFVNLGRSIAANELNATHIGPFAYRGSATTPEIVASFDWIRFTPDADRLASCEH
ncbi:MAG: DUF1349 domain-containing protein [Homoserinimonas sp.]